jgi:hypothetical protein
MKGINFYRKPISTFVMVAFAILLCSWANQAPAVSTAEKNSAATLQQGESDGPNVLEQEGSNQAAMKKGRKFPWLIAGIGAVAVGIAVYFLIKKKPDYTLTVALGTGCTGTPAASGTFKKGAVVSYGYTPQAGFAGLQVKLDGVVVPASGTVTMNGDHSLEVSSTQQFTLTVNLGAGTTGSPAATAVYNNGQAVNYSYSTQAGFTNLQVKLDGVVVPASGTVTMNTNHTLDVSGTQQFTLTVKLGKGVIGTPSATAVYNNGEVVNYSYRYKLILTALARSPLKVKIDGVLVSSSGTITMNCDHTLEAYLGGIISVVPETEK